MAFLLARRWPTALLLLWLPLAKWGLLPGWPRLALFYGGGCALAALAVWREGDWPRLRPLFARPGWGLREGLFNYAALVALATLLLYLPFLQPLLPFAVYDLVALFDPMPAYLAWARGDGLPPAGQAVGMWLGGAAGPLALTVGGAVAEEWVFRAVLFWRWVLSAAAADGARPWPGTALRLVGVSVYFAALHWPQPPGALLVALLGALVAGAALWRWRSFTLVATLHVLFNLHRLL